MTLHCLFG